MSFTNTLDRNAWQREYRLNSGNFHTKVYEKTKKGKLVRTYRNMKSRVLGICSEKAHLYGGLELLPKDDFYKWSLNNEDYHSLHSAWVNSGYARGLSPSIDRVDPKIGYTLGNIRWITHSENSSLGAKGRTKVE